MNATIEAKSTQVTEFSVEFLGIDHPQYFQGVSASYTDWDEVVCGIGDTPAEAFDDALECLAQAGFDCETIEAEEADYMAKRNTPSASEELRIDVSNGITPHDYGQEDFDEELHDALVEERMDGIDDYPQCYVAIYYNEP